MDRHLIGLITAWNCEDLIEPAIKQASKYCDEVLINVSAHTKELENHFEDLTVQKAYYASMSLNNLLFVNFEGLEKSYHSLVKPQILNGMLDHSRYYSVGSWIIILDSDEFYSEESWNIIREMIDNENINQILVEEKYFYINMQHYLLGDHNRLFKITEDNMDENLRFRPTQNWYNIDRKIGILPRETGMFHYGLLTNPWAKFAFWKSEYQGKTQDNKTLWLDKIYRNYNLNDEDRWIKENEKLFGIKSPWFSNSFKPDKNGKLFKYDGKHPDVIEESRLTKINDFRGSYGFLPNSN